jgi:glutamine amidotransferase
MCRWLAYAGPPITLGALLTRPDHSLIDQSRHARENVETTNGDGFGVGWYGEGPLPGAYRSTLPAWNDRNLESLAGHIRSPLFLAHVRAATGTPVQQTNCHPFQYENWLFQHNGSMPEFHNLKRKLLRKISPGLFPAVQGSTDSEVLFYLALTFGLRDDPPTALEETIDYLERVRQKMGVEKPIYFSAAVSDGQRLFAVRYSSHGKSRTLYHSRHLHALRDVNGAYDVLPDGGVVVVSEPLDELSEHWAEVPESTMLIVEQGMTVTSPFEPGEHALSRTSNGRDASNLL